MTNPTEWQKKLPMQITMARIYIVPVIIGLMVPQEDWSNWLAAALFIIASISDYYDGYFARKYNATSNLGKFMDPIADKILVSSILIMLITMKRIDPFMVILIAARDTYIGGIRAVAAADNIVIDAKPTGKWKTAMQMGAIPAIMIGDIWGLPLISISYVLLWVSVILSVVSGIEYYRSYIDARPKK